VQVIQTLLVQEGKPRNAAFHDRNWRRLNWLLNSPWHAGEFARPAGFDELISLAERIADGFDHLRVDFLECENRLWFGEITLYSWSGTTPFKPPEADLAFGSHWDIPSPAWRALKAIFLRRREIRPPAQPAPASFRAHPRRASPAGGGLAVAAHNRRTSDLPEVPLRSATPSQAGVE
jgi:hypothetical protein